MSGYRSCFIFEMCWNSFLNVMYENFLWVFLVSSQILEYCPQVGNDSFLLHPLQFTIHNSPIRRHILYAVDEASLNKLSNKQTTKTIAVTCSLSVVTESLIMDMKIIIKEYYENTWEKFILWDLRF
jgi:hypothetical protein